MLARAAVLAVVLPLVAAAGACGSGGASPQTPAGGEQAAKGSAEPAKGHKSLVDLRREFMAGCGSKVLNAPDYCECGWEQMQKTFTEEEMNAPDEDKAKLAQLRDRLEGACKSKLPEDQIKSGFVKSCVGEQPKLAPYCECNWGELRKRLSAAELTDDAIVKTERFTLAKREAAKTCGPRMPEDVARDGFLAGCAKDESLKPFCGCAWKALRAEKSAAEIEAGLVDLDALRPKIERSCSKLRPAK